MDCNSGGHECNVTAGVEDDARWCVNGNRGCGWVFVAHGHGRREEMCSASQVSNGIERGVGGLVMGAGTKGELTLSSGLCCSFTGFPRPQVALAAVSGVVSGFVQCRLDIIVLLPPCMFLIVAVWQ